MVAISLSAADRYVSWRHQELIDYFTDEVRRLIPGAASARVVSAHVSREAAATFRGVPGTARLRANTITRIPGVFLAGAWTSTGWPATMEGAVRSGIRAASAAREHIAHITNEKGAVA
jgi:uncharacterized protein with NAD-binding domain and iron-sulfur cluster